MTNSKNKELVKTIGRRLRETPEFSMGVPLSVEIERHLQLLRQAESQSGSGICTPDTAELTSGPAALNRVTD